ncbi:MAG: hypothetical protein P8Z36_11475, partial [Gemmatimonadota bacterium]
MSFARICLALFMVPLLLGAGACADRAQNATSGAVLNRQLSRAQRSNGAASAMTTTLAPTPASRRVTRPSLQAPEPAPPPARQPVAAQPAGPRPAASTPSATRAPDAAPQAAPVPTARAPRTVAMTVPIGAVLSVTLNQELSTRDNHAGDAFSTTLQEPFVQGSTVVLPAGAVIQGRVTAAQQSTRVGRTAVLKLAFDSVSFQGRSYPLSATVIEANPERRSRSSKAAGKIAAGAAAGALLGRILGKDTKSTVAGAAMGAAA